MLTFVRKKLFLDLQQGQSQSPKPDPHQKILSRAGGAAQDQNGIAPYHYQATKLWCHVIRL
jgi:hypothetical protein